MDIKLNSKIYPLEAILNAAYSFIDRAYIFLDSGSKGAQIKVSLKGRGKISKKQLEGLKGEFMNELLNCALRYAISRENKKIREYIVGRALYSFLPAEDLARFDNKTNYREDPLGIAKPWEKKFGKKSNAKKRKV